MRRSTLSTKLFAAALPLVLAVAALLALTVRTDLDDVKEAENGADLGRAWQPLAEEPNQSHCSPSLPQPPPKRKAAVATCMQRIERKFMSSKTCLTDFGKS